MIMTSLSLLFKVVSFELLDYIIKYLIIILQGVGWLLMISVLCSGVLCFIRFVNSRTPSVFNIILFTLLAFYLLLPISDQANILICSNESLYIISSPLEPEITGRALKVVGCTALVVWGEPGTLGTSFDILWSAAERALWVIDRVPPYLLGVIVGLLLSDGSIRIVRRGVNAYLQFRQSMSHFPYFMLVWNFLAPLCQGMFRIYTLTVKGTVCYAVRFHTRSLPFLTELYTLFYVNGVKVIPDGPIMYDLLTPIALAHWIIGDGTWQSSGLLLCADSFTQADNIKLIGILKIRYDLDCTLHASNRIYILARSIPRLRSIVLPYMDPSMLYKLGL